MLWGPDIVSCYIQSYHLLPWVVFQMTTLQPYCNPRRPMVHGDGTNKKAKVIPPPPP